MKYCVSPEEAECNLIICLQWCYSQCPPLYTELWGGEMTSDTKKCNGVATQVRSFCPSQWTSLDLISEKVSNGEKQKAF